MAQFTFAELTDILLTFGAAGENAYEAQNLYAERFPNRRIPNRRTFVATVQLLRDHGSLEPLNINAGRPCNRRNVNSEEQILQSIENRPELSCRHLAQEVDVSPFVVWRTLREQGLHPYHIQKVQVLYPGDEERRVVFSRWLLRQCQIEPDFLSTILFTDEAAFSRDGVFNVHNTHIWSDENPHATRNGGHQRTFSVNVWAGIVNSYLIGPYFLPNRLNEPGYFMFLQQTLPILLEEVPLAIRVRMWYLMDGAPP